MKQIQFRTIDAILIKFSLNGKFWVVCSMVALITSVVALLNYQQVKEVVAQASLDRAQASIDAIAQAAQLQQLSEANLQSFAQSAGLQLASQATTQRKGDQITVSAAIDGQFLQATHSVKKWEQEALDNAQMMLWIALLGLYPLFQLSYWISTSLGGGLWDMYLAIKRLADGDLSFRLNFFGTDDFSLIAREIDRCADNMSEMVSAIRKNAETLSLASDEFHQQATTSGDLINFQHQFLDSVAVAMDQKIDAEN